MNYLDLTNCKALEAKSDSRQKTAQKQILHLLMEHFYETDFSLIRLSELSNHSVSYIARCLKEETGCSFMQLVTNLRISKAKRELVDTDDPIKEIVGRCGYLDCANFTRKFKGIVGITPSEFRNINEKDNRNVTHSTQNGH